MDAGIVQGAVNVVVRALQQADKRVLIQLLNGNLGKPGKAVILRKDCHQRVLRQGDGAHSRRTRQSNEAQIHTALPKPLVYVVVVTAAHFQLGTGMGSLKCPDHTRQPVHGDTGEHAQPDGACVGVADLVDALRERLLFGKNLLHFRQEHPPGLRQYNAAPVAPHEAETVFFFQIVENMADSGLGGAKRLGGFRQAAQLHSSYKCFIFFQAHGDSFLTMRKFHSIL